MATLPHILCAHLPADQHPVLRRFSGSAPPLCSTSGARFQLQAVSTTSVFEAEAPAGPVECHSRGCRPVYDDDEACSAYDNGADDHDDNLRSLATRPLGAASMGAAAAGNVLGGGGLAPCQIERLICGSGMWAELKKAECYYESALQLEPRNSLLLLEYALFAWNALADVARADQLFHQALHLAPSNPSILASYASFLWQTEPAS